jgi:tetratricopeptide (TPR) repeat protein
MRPHHCLLLLVMLLWSPAPVFGQADSWVGKTVMMREPNTRIVHLNDQGQEIIVAVLEEASYTVLGEKEGRIQLKARDGKAYWLAKTKAVLLAAAPDFFTKEIHNSPNDPDPLLRRAIALDLLGKLDLALKDFGEVIQLAPNDTTAYYLRGGIWARRQQFDKAVADFSEAIRIDPKDPRGYLVRGMTYNAQKQHDKAVADFTEVINRDPRNHLAYAYRGWTRGIKGELDSAVADYNEAIRIDPNFAQAYLGRGTIWERKKADDKAFADYSEVLRLDPGNAWAHTFRGSIWVRKQDFDKAITDFSVAIQLDPDSSTPFFLRGAAWERKQDYNQAIADYAEAMRLDPKNPGAFNNLAWMFATCPDARFRDGKRAVELARTACELTNWKELNDVDTLAAAYAEAGDFKEAVRYQEMVLRDPRYTNQKGFQFRLELYRQGRPYRKDLEKQNVEKESSAAPK